MLLAVNTGLTNKCMKVTYMESCNGISDRSKTVHVFFISLLLVLLPNYYIRRVYTWN